MNNPGQWLSEFADGGHVGVDGFVPVRGYVEAGRPPEEVAVMEKAKRYGANAVFFQASSNSRPSVPQAFIYRSDGPVDDPDFASLHRRLWSWGGVPLVYRVTNGLVQLFRCAHGPDFERNGEIVCRPFRKLKLASDIASDPWWDADRLCTGTLWDDPEVCKKLLSGHQAAQKTLIQAVQELHEHLNHKKFLPHPLQRKLLILSVLIAYLEARKVFEDGFFSSFRSGATRFFEVLADGPALVKLLDSLERRFNGNVFTLSDEDRQTLQVSHQLTHFARLVEGRQESSGQLTLWERYSFADLPVELISHIYQLFVKDSTVAVYTPHFVVRLMLGEVLSWERLDRLEQNNEVILDPACGSGIFLVEAYKRLVLHWRFRHNWEHPDITTLRKLLETRLRGVDLEPGAVELSAFSLCLALCDALEPEEIRASVKLFPPLKEKTIHTGCFFETRERGVLDNDPIGVVVGNPPFASRLDTDGSKKAYERYQREHGQLPDRQVAYLFLHESMQILVPGGILSMLQQYNFLYNQQSAGFRKAFMERWDVREILDFISIRGLFKKSKTNTTVLAVIAEAQTPKADRQILHATFRRSGRTDAEQGFDIDYYDMHWLPRELALNQDRVWRSDLLGGGRVLGFVERLMKMRTLREYATDKRWDFGEGYIEGKKDVSRPAEHIIGHSMLPSDAIGERGIDASRIESTLDKPIEGPRSERRFTPPMLLVREQYDLHHGMWLNGYLTYKNQTVGFCAPASDIELLSAVSVYFSNNKKSLRAFVAGISIKLFTQHATTLSGVDIFDLPFPISGNLDVSRHEQILVDDMVDYYRDLIRLGEKSAAMSQPGLPALPDFNEIYIDRINGIYKKNPLRALEPQAWPGLVCQPYIFGKGTVDWSGADELRGKLDALLREKRGDGLNVTRIARLYDGACIYLFKPDRLRYWLRSIALRDADETLADLAEQGF